MKSDFHRLPEAAGCEIIQGTAKAAFDCNAALNNFFRPGRACAQACAQARAPGVADKAMA